MRMRAAVLEEFGEPLAVQEVELAEVVSSRAGSRAYRVTPEGEEPLEARLLSG